MLRLPRALAVTPNMAEGRCQLAAEAAIGCNTQHGEGGRETSPASSAAMAASNPWDPAQPTAAGALLARCVAAGVVSQVRRG